MTSTGPSPHLIAQLDQFAASARDFALFISAIRDELLEAGFTRPEATSVITSWIRSQ